MNLTIPVPMAGKVLGLVSEEGAYAHVSKHLQVITLGQRKQVVLAAQLATFLQVSLEVLEQRINEIEKADREAAPAKAAKEAREKAAAAKLKAEQINQYADGILTDQGKARAKGAA